MTGLEENIMLISELIQELQEILDCSGNVRVVYRDDEISAIDVDIFSLYYDENTDKVILSNDLDFGG
jgi:predicted nuclease of predicted toxin-antitoxin system